MDTFIGVYALLGIFVWVTILANYPTQWKLSGIVGRSLLSPIFWPVFVVEAWEIRKAELDADNKEMHNG